MAPKSNTIKKSDIPAVFEAASCENPRLVSQVVMVFTNDSNISYWVLYVIMGFVETDIPLSLLPIWLCIRLWLAIP